MELPMPVLISPSIQRYAWGDPSYLPQLFKIPEDGTPWAEAWFGDHPSAPAYTKLGANELPLNELIRDTKSTFLGSNLALRHSNLPYLLKILACAKPLSIQVHPSRMQAAEGYAREEKMGIALNEHQRAYRDSNHKPEILVAWTEFHALVGFRHGNELAKALGQAPELVGLLPEIRPDPAGLRLLLEAYFALPDKQVEERLFTLVNRLEAENEQRPFLPIQPAYWVLQAHRELSVGKTVDRGLIFVFLLELVTLQPGEAIFIPPGVPHAYLKGAGLEMMANSDNVLRAGLTSKHVNTAELLQIVRFDAGASPKLSPIQNAASGEAIYPLPTEELDLRRVTMLPSQLVTRHSNGPETVVVQSNNQVIMTCNGTDLQLEQGQACLIPSGTTYTLQASQDAQIFVASTPNEPQQVSSFRGRDQNALAFGTSGLRGLVDDITDLETYINTCGFLDYLLSNGEAVYGMPVAIAGDLRPSTARILLAVAKAITDSGFTVVYCGRIPSPALAHFAFQKRWPSVMVTGSHIPFDRNGIKFNKPSGEVLKSDEAPILEAVARVRVREYGREQNSSLFSDKGAFTSAVAGLPDLSEEAAELYRQRYLDAFPADALKGLRIALYEHSAVGRDLITDILRSLGAEVHTIGRSERFMAIDTEAIAAERLQELQTLADILTRQVGRLDALVSTDGDSDRPMLLGFDHQRKVRFFGGDILGAVVAEYLGADCIVIPVSSNDAIDQHFGAHGIAVTRTRIGSPWVIAEMATLSGQRRMGWEANGGFLLGTAIETPAGRLSPLPTRDATLPLVAALHAAHREKIGIVELFARLPERYSRSGLLDAVDPLASRALLERFGLGDINLRRAHFDADEIILHTRDGKRHPIEPAIAHRLFTLRSDLESHFSSARGFGRLNEIDILDGIRLHFTGGDIAHIRPSGNAPQLRIYAVADTASRAEAIVADALAEPDGILRRLLLQQSSH